MIKAMPITDPETKADCAMTSRPTPIIDCACEDVRWEKLQDGLVCHAIFILDWLGLPPAQLSLKLVDDAAMAALNARYRNTQGATNVLAFPAHDFPAPLVRDFPAPLARDFPAPLARDFAAPLVRDFPPAKTDGLSPAETDGVLLGDVVLAYDRLADEAQRGGISLKNHAVHLLTHGVLHLLGYTHDAARDAALMEKLESALLLAQGLPDPYAKSVSIKGKTA